jgi:hypothetical protein
MMPMKRGYVVASAAMGFALLCLMLWPYRLETVESIVSANQTGCTISTTSNGGWRNGVLATRVAYPLDVRVFVNNCDDAPKGRPDATALVSMPSEKVIASGLSCARSRHEEGYPCRLEMPALYTLSGQDHYLVQVMTTKGGEVRSAELRLLIKHEWRSVVFDALMSV